MKIKKKGFNAGYEVYRGYVDDPRNTDNAWMETVATNFQDETGDFVGKLNFQAGDDASKVTWLDIHRELPLYANHLNFIQVVVDKYNAHW
jgi:hypothetical protein